MLRLLIAGDSAAAGVGATRQEDALAGRITSGLASRYRVGWTVDARSGATTASTHARLSRRTDDSFDVAVMSLGVNDVTSGLSRPRWRTSQRNLRALLRNKFDVGLIVCCGLPPMRGFPGLPQPLRWYLGERADQFSRDLRDDVEFEPGCAYLGLDFTSDVSLIAADGYHPGPGMYALWGRKVSELVAVTLGSEAGSGY